ncbi:hypothetical protein SK854_39630 [Lentzea sp. BCCO 10_0061]|uniref:Uncharacterized protein n=1 Tax=Lentzea sokolovensis TaxID=3095429 RepID=A0ABU4VBQ2_9PSEU|nr:hypothetical protein [Lentzea sp. BCCO 10_0061]MDX8148280.1 hypothetical protein [Lentzea sp. BCCO 10_0061]
MLSVVCQAVRWVDDEMVEVRFTDATGATRSFVDRAAVLGDQWLTLDVEFPVDVELACEVVSTDGELVTVSTERPWGVTTVDGHHEFLVTPYQLRHGGAVAREIGFYESADEVRAAVTGDEQPWERDALRYLEQGHLVVIPLSWETDLLDPDGPGVKERGEWTDGVWFWSGALVHYLRKYHVALPEEFLAHMAANRWEVPRMTDEESLAAACLRYPFLAEEQAAPVAEG